MFEALNALRGRIFPGRAPKPAQEWVSLDLDPEMAGPCATDQEQECDRVKGLGGVTTQRDEGDLDAHVAEALLLPVAAQELAPSAPVTANGAGGPKAGDAGDSGPATDGACSGAELPARLADNEACAAAAAASSSEAVGAPSKPARRRAAGVKAKPKSNKSAKPKSTPAQKTVSLAPERSAKRRAAHHFSGGWELPGAVGDAAAQSSKSPS